MAKAYTIEDRLDPVEDGFQVALLRSVFRLEFKPKGIMRVESWV